MVIFRCVDDSIQFAASAQLSAQVVMVTNMDVILEVILFPYSQQLCRGRCVCCEQDSCNLGRSVLVLTAAMQMALCLLFAANRTVAI